jgi:MFS family permease
MPSSSLRIGCRSVKQLPVDGTGKTDKGWLHQGPYIYPLYKQTLQLPENVIAALFSTGFISGAVSATFVGNLADRYGRRKACLSFCVIYSLSSLMILSPDSIFLLFMGRFLGGIGTTMLFSIFETWLVAEFHRLRISREGTELSSLLGTMTMLNSIIAIMAGLLSEWLVHITGTRRAPFVASIACLALAFLTIFRKWVCLRCNVYYESVW